MPSSSRRLRVPVASRAGTNASLSSALMADADGSEGAAPSTAPEVTTRSERAAKQTRDAATWLAGAFAAIAAILVAGSQLSDMGALDAGTPRWLGRRDR